MRDSISIKTIARALRLPFTTASALPFIFGSLFAEGHLDYTAFWLGLFAVVTAHLGANLINDYADSRSGVDWYDKNSYKFFGGSKLIQEGILTEKFYLILSVILFGLSGLTVLGLALIMQSALVIYVAFFVTALSWSYSMKPLQLSYNRLGEITVFILFGPVPVMGGYYLQTGIFPDFISLMVSIPFGLLTAAILYANEIPDFADDKRAGKNNLANSLWRENSYLGYYALSLLGFIMVVINVTLDYINSWSLLSLVAIILTIKAATILKNFYKDKTRLMESAKLSIAIQTSVSLILIGAVIL